MAIKAIKGMTIEIGGDTTKLGKALEAPNQKARDLQGELREVNRLLKLDPTNTDLLAQKQKLLGDAIANTKDKLNTLKDAQKQVSESVKNYDAWKEKYDPIQAEIDETNKKLSELKKQSEEAKKALDAGDINPEKYNVIQKEIEDTEGKLKLLKQQAEDVSEEFGNPASHEQYRELQREVIATEQELKRLEATAKNSNLTMEKVADAANKIGQGAENMGRKLMPLTTAITAAGTASVKFGSDFNDSMAKASTLIDTSIFDMDDLKEKVLEVSDETGIAATQLGESMYNALSASVPMGEQGADMMAFLSSNTRLAKVGFTDIDTAVTTTAKTLNAYGKGVSEVNQIHKVLLQTQNLGIVTVGELGENLAKVTPTAAAMGLSFEQVGASLAVMTAQGTPAAQATTQLNSLISELGKEGTKSSIILRDKTGKSFKQLMQDGKTLTDVLELMREGWSENSYAIAQLMGEIDKSTGTTYTFEAACEKLGVSVGDAESELIDLFGSLEAGKSALALGGENAGKFKNALDAMSDSTDVVGTAFEKMETDSHKAQLALNQLKNLSIDLGQTILTMLQPAIESVGKKVRQASDWFKGLSDKQKQMVVTIGGVVAALGPALIIFGKLSQGFSSILTLTSKIGPALSGFKAGLGGMGAAAATGPVLAVVAAIAALVAVLVVAYNKVDWFRELVDDSFAKIKASISEAIEAAKPALEELMAAFGELMDALRPVIEFIAKYVLARISGVIAMLPKVAAAVKDAISFISNILNGLMALLKGDFSGAGEYLKSAFGDAFSFIKNALTGIWTFFTTFFKGLGIDIEGFLSNAWEAITGVFLGIGQWFTDRWNDVKAAFAAVGTFFAESFQTAWDAITGVFSAIGQWFSDRWNDVTTFLSPITTWFAENFQIAWNNIVAIFSFLGGWFAEKWEEVKQALAAVGTWFGEIFTAAWNGIVAVFTPVGEWFAARWADIQAVLAPVVEWFREKFKAAWDAITGVFTAIGSWFGERWNDVKQALGNVATFFADTFSKAWDKVKEAFANVGSFFGGLWDKIVKTFTDIGVKIGDAVSGAFRAAVNGVFQTVENIVNGFINAINGVIGLLNNIPGLSLSKFNTLSLPRLAKGGRLKEGQAMVAEAGPEIIRMVNGEAIVAPLTASAKNTALGEGAGGDIYHITVPLEYHGPATQAEAQAMADEVSEHIEENTTRKEAAFGGLRPVPV